MKELLTVMHIIILEAEGWCWMRVGEIYTHPTFQANNIEHCLCSLVMYYLIAKETREAGT